MQARAGSLSNAITKLRAQAEGVLRASCRLLLLLRSELSGEDKGIYTGVCDGTVLATHPRNQVIQRLLRVVLDNMKDAETVDGELDQFAAAVVKNEDAVDECGCPFMQQVWCGDVYSVSDVPALLVLIEDLESARGNVDVTRFIVYGRELLMEESAQPCDNASQEHTDSSATTAPGAPGDDAPTQPTVVTA